MRLIIAILLTLSVAHSKEIALTFDDAPGDTTLHFKPEQRTDELIRKLKGLKVPPVIIFANPCNGNGPKSNFAQLTKFKNAGHIIGNHTCTHPRFDDVGPDQFVADTVNAENIIGSLMGETKYFRYPFFNEGKIVAARDQFRAWLS
ncbi:MAG: polysaccharide deacetylase family protein [Bdellovibrio sp.]|nr:polysaccharide deacetylase family protein [Bdellovibrio sp.]